MVELWMKSIKRKKAPKGFRWIFTRYRRVKNSHKMLDAHAYGYDAWVFLARV